MKTWMLPWLLPVGLLVTVVLVAIFKDYVAFAAVIAGWLLVPVLWRLRIPATAKMPTRSTGGSDPGSGGSQPFRGGTP